MEATYNEEHDFATFCLFRLRPHQSEVRTGFVERLSLFVDECMMKLCCAEIKEWKKGKFR